MKNWGNDNEFVWKIHLVNLWTDHVSQENFKFLQLMTSKSHLPHNFCNKSHSLQHHFLLLLCYFHGRIGSDMETNRERGSFTSPTKTFNFQIQFNFKDKLFSLSPFSVMMGVSLLMFVDEWMQFHSLLIIIWDRKLYCNPHNFAFLLFCIWVF